MEANRETCFVTMPFSKTSEEHTEEYWTKHFETFLKPLIEINTDLEAHRSQALRGDVLRQIITNLVVSRLVVADLTDHNPNVFWELGVRQSFKHGTVTVAEEGTELPFDVGVKGTLFYYPRNHLKMEVFREQFKRAIQDCLLNPDNPDSHVLETISGRGTLFEIFRREEALRWLDALLLECDRNIKDIETILDKAEENQRNPEGRKFYTYRFGISATELLVTSRYIDEGQSFYKLAELILRELIRLNDQLNIWELSPESVEKWLLKKGKAGIPNFFKEFKIDMEKARNKLFKRF